jgi:hypothetical protein
MAFPKKLKELCTPAFLYFSLAMLGVLVSVVQNLGNSRRYNLGMLSARVPSTFLVFVVKIIYILFWTWVLNLMCKDGHKEIAWFLVLIPFILLFLLMGSMMGGSYEGFGVNANGSTNAVCPSGYKLGSDNKTCYKLTNNYKDELTDNTSEVSKISTDELTDNTSEVSKIST